MCVLDPHQDCSVGMCVLFSDHSFSTARSSRMAAKSKQSVASIFWFRKWDGTLSRRLLTGVLLWFESMVGSSSPRANVRFDSSSRPLASFRLRLGSRFPACVVVRSNEASLLVLFAEIVAEAGGSRETTLVISFVLLRFVVLDVFVTSALLFLFLLLLVFDFAKPVTAKARLGFFAWYLLLSRLSVFMFSLTIHIGGVTVLTLDCGMVPRIISLFFSPIGSMMAMCSSEFGKGVIIFAFSS
mmetsp:Transcript_29505/g.61489  ORF Transcript_29505/g.61489 Transcript_29505/m.61489 type:complete len:241 (-) Transcript_29505:249-971(-)